MNPAKINFKKRSSLVIFWNKYKNQVWSFNKKEKKIKEITSLDAVRPKEYRKSILILGRNLYIFKVVQFPKLKKTMIDKAIKTNIEEWSPFRKSKYFYFSYPKDNKIFNLISILKQEDYDEIMDQLRSKGIKIDTIIPESFCYYDFFKGKEKTLGAVKKEDGVELIYFDEGIKESQYIPIQKWNKDSFSYFIKGIGPEGLELNKVLWIGIEENEKFSFPDDYSPEYIKTDSEIDSILKGSEFFSSPVVKNFGKTKFAIFDKEDLKYLKPGIAIVLAGVLLFYLSGLYSNIKKVNYFKKELSNFREKTQGIEDKIDVMDNLKGKVEFVYDNAEKHPSQLSIFLELQRYFPEETYLMRYSFGQNKMEISGISSKSSELISRLSASKFFTNIKFISPVEKERITGKERFSIEINLKE